LRHPLTFRRLCTSLLAHGNSWQPLPSPLVVHFLGVNGSWWRPLQFPSLSVLNGRSGQLMTFSLRPSSLPISGSSFQLIAVTTTALQTHRAIDFAAIVVRDTVSQTKSLTIFGTLRWSCHLSRDTHVPFSSRSFIT